jgi:hypothetical protein
MFQSLKRTALFAASAILILLCTSSAAAAIRRVNHAAAGANNGTSWGDAYTQLQTALAGSTSGDEIWVAAGTYKPSTTGTRTQSFVVSSGVALYGGFNGTETLLTQRNVSSNLVILSGDLSGNDNSNLTKTEPTRLDNSHHVLQVLNATSQCIIDGFTIQSGHAEITNTINERGAGILCVASVLTLNKCVLRSNYARTGAAFNDDVGSSNIAVRGCSFIGNQQQRGGTVAINSTFDVRSSLFYQNRTSDSTDGYQWGGGLFISDTTGKVVNCVFAENHATEEGGGVYNHGNTEFINCAFVRNSSSTWSTALHDRTNEAVIKNCVFWGNTGTGLVISNDSRSSGTPAFNAIIQGGYTAAGSTNILNSDPLFQDINAPLGADSIFGTEDDGLYLVVSSPAINAGNNSYVPAGVTLDAAGLSRFYGTVDLGPYERTAIKINAHPLSATIQATMGATFSVSAEGNGTLSYQWRKDGVDIPTATGSSYNITSAQPWHVGEYVVMVTDTIGTASSRAAQLSINDVNSSIWEGLMAFYTLNGNTKDITGMNGDAVNHGATSSVGKTGVPDSSFSFDGIGDYVEASEMPGFESGAISVSLWLYATDLSPQNRVRSDLVSKDDVQRQWTMQLEQSGQIRTAVFTTGGTFVFNSTMSVSTGTWNHIAYTWDGSLIRVYVNGVLGGSLATTGSMVAGNAPVRIGGSDVFDQYVEGSIDDVMIFNRALSPASVQQLYDDQFEPMPEITEQPSSRSGYAGQSTTFNVLATGTGTVSYQWRKNGVNITTATSSALTLSPLNYRSAAEYDVVVTDDLGSVISDPAELTVLSPAPNVSISPGDTMVALGGGLTFTATVGTGIPPYTYQWRKNGAAIAKATNATLVLTNLQRTQEGVYDVVVKNGHGVDVSNPARLSLPPVVPVNNAPESTDVNPAGTATFTVNVPGATAWQWLKNGVAIKGATASTLTVPNVDASSAGLYSVTVTTPNGKVTTLPAQLRVNDAGLLIYKLTGTGKAYEGTVATNAALSGYLVLDRAGQRGGLIIGSKSGSQSIHRLEIHEDLDTQSTGPVPKSQTVVSELVAGEFALWMDGTDGLLTISKTDKAVGPATMKGSANSIDLDSNVRIETVSLTLTLDAVNSTPARLFQETVEQAMSRISQDMQAKGSALVE